MPTLCPYTCHLRMQATKRANTTKEQLQAALTQQDKLQQRCDTLQQQLNNTVKEFESLLSAASDAQEALISRTRRSSIASADAKAMQTAASALQQAIAARDAAASGQVLLLAECLL